VVVAPVDAMTGPVTRVACAGADTRVVVTGSQGSVAVLEAEQVPVISRAAKGKPIVSLKKGEKAAGLAVLAAG
jgi:DNA gyrase/topoisomerase IV subunit A